MIHVIGNEATWYTTYFLETAAYCAVNTYGMISGYVGITARHRPARIVELWMTVFWYSALGTLAGVFLFGLPVSEDTLWKAIFPTMWKTYWYFSAYVGVFLAGPYLNRMVKTLSLAEKKRLLLALFAVFSVFTCIPRASETGSDFLGIGAGYSFLWLAVMYLMGALVRCLIDESPKDTQDFLHKKSWFYGILYLVCVVITWMSKFLIEGCTEQIFGERRYGRILFSYAGPTVVICAFALLMIFSRLQIKSRTGKGLIKALAPMAFSVYLVQVQPYFWSFALDDSCRNIAEKSPIGAFFSVIGCAALLYMICTGIDIVRALLFHLLHIRRWAEIFTGFVLRPFHQYH